jgi:hypothetical protein
MRTFYVEIHPPCPVICHEPARSFDGVELCVSGSFFRPFATLNNDICSLNVVLHHLCLDDGWRRTVRGDIKLRFGPNSFFSFRLLRLRSFFFMFWNFCRSPVLASSHLGGRTGERARARSSTRAAFPAWVEVRPGGPAGGEKEAELKEGEKQLTDEHDNLPCALCGARELGRTCWQLHMLGFMQWCSASAEPVKSSILIEIYTR